MRLLVLDPNDKNPIDKKTVIGEIVYEGRLKFKPYGNAIEPYASGLQRLLAKLPRKLILDTFPKNEERGGNFAHGCVEPDNPHYLFAVGRELSFHDIDGRYVLTRSG